VKRPELNPRRVMDWTAVLFPLACSVAANTTWAARPVYRTVTVNGVNFLTYGPDVVAVVAGFAIPVLLVLSVDRWHTGHELEGWRWWVRLAAMVAVTAVVAAVSWVHTSLLLYHHGWELPLAVAGPLGIDGLAVLGTLALWPAKVGSDDLPAKEEPATLPVPDEPAPEPVVLKTVAPTPVTDSLSALLDGNRDDVWAAASQLGVARRAGEKLPDLRGRCRAALADQTPTDPEQQEA
jgi:hypothetical protein